MKIRQLPYHIEHTSSRPIIEVKQFWAWLVLGFLFPNSVDIAEIAMASDILFDSTISDLMCVGSNPPQGANFIFIFSNILKHFRLIFHFSTFLMCLLFQKYKIKSFRATKFNFDKKGCWSVGHSLSYHKHYTDVRGFESPPRVADIILMFWIFSTFFRLTVYL